MLEKVVTGASDWRSDAERDKSHLRTAVMSLFKTWIPEHPEAAAERDQVYGLFKQAMGRRPRITFVSTLSTGIDDVVAYEYLDQPVSMQEILVQREGTDAFLDPRNALRVVRRKYGMMTLITRMTGALEHRNVIAVSIDADIERAQLAEFSRLVAARIVDSAAEEEQTLRKALSRAGLRGVDILFHSDVVGRRLPVPWEVKQLYALVGRAIRTPSSDSATAARQVLAVHLDRLDLKSLRQLSLYQRELNTELDAPLGLDIGAEAILKAREPLLLAVTRELFDEYQETRRTSLHQRALNSTSAQVQALELAAETADFVADAEGASGFGENDELIRIARALERIRSLRGREFFTRISMVGGELDFESAVRAGQGFEAVERTMAALDPLEALRTARRIVEPLFRARALGAAAVTLAALGRQDDALAGVHESLDAARACTDVDAAQAYAATLEAALAAHDEATTTTAIDESMGRAHALKDFAERAAALMRLVSTLFEGGALPVSARAALGRAALGPDIHFWGRKEVEPPLVEALVSLLPTDENDTQIFLQKVVAHTNPTVRAGVVRTMPLSDAPGMRNMLLAHLKDREPQVRCEVIERIGASGERALVLYLVNYAKHLQESGAQSPPTPPTRDEKRTLALNLVRLDGERQLPLVNAMLGTLHTEGPGLTDRQKPLKDDVDLQLAGLEVLIHLNSRTARRLLFNAAERARKRGGPVADLFLRSWAALKSAPYGDPSLPRSPHDPTWTEADLFDLDAWLETARPVAPEPAEAAPEAAAPEAGPASAARPERPAQASREAPRKPGLLERLKRRFLGDPDDAPEESRARGPEPESTTEAAPEPIPASTPLQVAPTVAPPIGPSVPARPLAALVFEAEVEGAAPGPMQLDLALYDKSDATQPVWTESQSTFLEAGGKLRLELGRERPLPAPLPAEVWLGLSVNALPETTPRIKVSRARSVVQG